MSRDSVGKNNGAKILHPRLRTHEGVIERVGGAMPESDTRKHRDFSDAEKRQGAEMLYQFVSKMGEADPRLLPEQYSLLVVAYRVTQVRLSG